MTVLSCLRNSGVSIQRLWRLLAAFAVLSGMAPAAPVHAANSTDPAVQKHIKAFYEVFLRRLLTSSEWSEILAEGIRSHTDYTPENLQATDSVTQSLRNEDGSPAALHLRHRIITLSMFDPNSRNTFSARLIFQIDPVSVLDVRNKTLMTVKDVLALGNIETFAHLGFGPPDINPAVPDLGRALKRTSELRDAVANGQALPELYCDAAAFWAGLVQQWPDLTRREREAARHYAFNTITGLAATMPDALYVKLMGHNKNEITDQEVRDRMHREQNGTLLGQSYNQTQQNLIGESLAIGNVYQNFSVTPYP